MASKYSRDELRSMAQNVLLDRQTNDFRYIELLLAMPFRTGLSESTIVRKIEELVR